MPTDIEPTRSPVAWSSTVMSLPPVLEIQTCPASFTYPRWRCWPAPTSTVTRSTMVSARSRVPAIASGAGGEDGDAVARVREEQVAAAAEDHVTERRGVGLLGQRGRADDRRRGRVDDHQLARAGAGNVGDRSLEEPVGRPIHHVDRPGHPMLGRIDHRDGPFPM